MNVINLVALKTLYVCVYLSYMHYYSNSNENVMVPGVAGVAGLGHYKNRAEKQRTVDSSVGGGGGGGGSSSSAVLNTARLEGQAVCKTERLQALSTPLGPYDKNYSRKRLREHSLDRTDCKSYVNEACGRKYICILQVPGVKHLNPSDEFVLA